MKTTSILPPPVTDRSRASVSGTRTHRPDTPNGLLPAEGNDAQPIDSRNDPAQVLDLRARLAEAIDAWLRKSPSSETRSAYARELEQFCLSAGVSPGCWETLTRARPANVATWRDELLARGLSNASVGRKLSVIRSLFAYLQAFGYAGANPADTQYVSAPAVPRDGKTPALSPEETRFLLDAPEEDTPQGLRDRALLAVLAFTGCRVGELTRLRVTDYRLDGSHKVLEVRGKGGKERKIPLHPEAFDRLDAWLAHFAPDQLPRMLFPAMKTGRGKGAAGFRDGPMSRRSVQYLVAAYVKKLEINPNITVHSFRVTALTTARERGADLVDLQDFAGHADPRTTLTYIRNRDKLHRSPAYLLKY